MLSTLQVRWLSLLPSPSTQLKCQDLCQTLALQQWTRQTRSLPSCLPCLEDGTNIRQARPVDSTSGPGGGTQAEPPHWERLEVSE